MVTKQDIFNEALKWEGVAWKHQGRTKRGIDCVGLLVLVGQSLELTTFDLRNYPRRPDGTFLSYFDEHLSRINSLEMQIGDIAVFSGVEHKHVCHCGIVGIKYSEPSIVHAHANRRKVIHERLSESRSVIGSPVRAYSFKGVA